MDRKQGLDINAYSPADISRLNIKMNRRKALLMGATGLMTVVGLSGQRRVFAGNTVVSTPALEEGPYWIDETGSSFYRADIRGDIGGANVQAGLPMYLNLTVSQVSNGVVTPLPNAYVYIWGCNAYGLYSGEAALSTSSATYLRGYQISNANGNLQFLTIYPGWYSGRTTHNHLRVRIYPNNDPTKTPTYDFETQLFYDDSVSNYIYKNVSPYTLRPIKDTTNATDHVYTGGSRDADGVVSNAGALTTATVANDTSYVVGSFNMILNLSLAESTGSSGGSGGTGGTGGTGGPGRGGPGRR